MVTPELQALTDRSPVTLRASQRRALSPRGVRIYARLAATAATFGIKSRRAAVADAEPYASVAEFKADLDVIDRSLVAGKSGIVARGRLRFLRRAVDCFGFHLASLDMRQNSSVHERTIADFWKRSRPARIIWRYRKTRAARC